MSTRDFDELQEWTDGYLAGMLDEATTARLEQRLRSEAEARAWFVRYCQLHTDLHLLMRAQHAGDRVLQSIGVSEASPAWSAEGGRVRLRFPRSAAVAALAACLVLVTGLTWWFARRTVRAPVPDNRVAWLVNAQNCQWSEETASLGDLRAGGRMTLRAGLAEIRFASGATVILEGPAALELRSARSARLLHGRLAARVPDSAKGFEILSPQGRVVDLGTEFGVSVGDDGSASVQVFSGRVQAHAGESGPAVDLRETQVAQIAAGGVSVQPPGSSDAGPFVREISPAPVIIPRELVLDFRKSVAGTVRDRSGLETGLTHRLPGTGAQLHPHDSNLRLDTQVGALEITTTKSDINLQQGMGEGEYLGIRLADLGFTGGEDFEITVMVPNIPALQTVGQFGLYAGSRSDCNIRGGLISREEPQRYGQFLVNNSEGRDQDLHVVGLLSSGDDLKLSLRRRDNRYALSVENQSTGSSSTLNIRHPAFLDGENDLNVGFFGANTQSEVRKTLVIKEMRVTVWTKSPAGGRRDNEAR